MAELDIAKTTYTDLDNTIDNYSVDPRATDSVGEGDKETYYDNTKFTEYFGYYKEIPELKKAIDALATWTLGQGWTADAKVTAILENINGWGEDTFQSIMWNLLTMKKVAGDSFAEIIRNEDTGELINLKPLDPSAVRIVTNKQGVIVRYEQRSKTGRGRPFIKFQPHEILHLCNDRVADEIHGTSVVEACKWTIDARNEILTDYRKVLHRNVVPVRIIEVDEDDTTKLNTLKTQWQNAINKGEVLILPTGTAAVKDSTINIQDPLSFIKYLENFFYTAVGIPKVILGGSEEFTEASSKVGYLTFEQMYVREHVELEADLYNQLGIRIKFNKPVSIKNELLQSEQKNTGQVGIQPNETSVGLTRTE